ncbi:hypothetical protein YC2023_016501 [Brassica napus]
MEKAYKSSLKLLFGNWVNKRKPLPTKYVQVVRNIRRPFDKYSRWEDTTYYKITNLVIDKELNPNMDN